MVFCGKRKREHIEFVFTNEEFKYLCENTNSYFLGVILDSHETTKMEGMFWINHYQFEILWELDQISNRRFLHIGESGVRKLLVSVEKRLQPAEDILSKLNLLRSELTLDDFILNENQKELVKMVDHHLTCMENIMRDPSIEGLHFNADVFLLQSESNQKHQLRSEQMSLLEFSQRKEISPFVEY